MQGDFHIGDWLVQPAICRLSRRGESVHLRAKATDLLVCLAEQAGSVVSKEEIFDRVWKTRFVTDSALTRVVTELRQALGDDVDRPALIETIPKRGYRVIAPVTLVPGDPRAPLEEERRRWSPRRIAAAAFVAAASCLWLALTWTESGSPVPPRAMLAVLPFENLSGNPADEFFADGLTDELITRIARIDPARLGVIARASSMHFKGAGKTVAEVGRALDVEYLLDGGVRRDKGQFRVTAHLVRVADQTHVWTAAYDHRDADLIRIQTNLASRVADALSLTLLSGHSVTAQPHAYEAYLEGRFYWNRRTTDDLHRSIVHFNRALAIQPDLALAHVGLADAYTLLGLSEYRQEDPVRTVAEARRALARALEIDGALAEAHASLGGIRFAYDWDWRRAEESLLKAIELNPNYATAHHWYANLLSYMGRAREAIAESTLARRLDPLSLIINTDAGYILHMARQHEAAAAQLRATLSIDPRFSLARWYLGNVYEQLGRGAEALAEYQKAAEGSMGTVTSLETLACGYAAAGNAARALEILRDLEERAAGERVDSAALANVHLALGNAERAMGLLEKAYAERSDYLVELKVQPRFDPLRPDPRFVELLRRMNLAG